MQEQLEVICWKRKRLLMEITMSTQIYFSQFDHGGKRGYSRKLFESSLDIRTFVSADMQSC